MNQYKQRLRQRIETILLRLRFGEIVFRQAVILLEELCGEYGEQATGPVASQPDVIVPPATWESNNMVRQRAPLPRGGAAYGRHI